MSNLTIRIEDELKNQAMKQAEEIGVSLSLVVKNALKHFVQNPVLIIGDSEEIEAIDKKAKVNISNLRGLFGKSKIDSVTMQHQAWNSIVKKYT